MLPIAAAPAPPPSPSPRAATVGVFVVTGSLSSALSGCFPSELCKAKKKATNAVPLTVPGLLLKLTVQADVLGSQWESLSLKLAKGKKESCPSGSHRLPPHWLLHGPYHITHPRLFPPLTSPRYSAAAWSDRRRLDAGQKRLAYAMPVSKRNAYRSLLVPRLLSAPPLPLPPEKTKIVTFPQSYQPLNQAVGPPVLRTVCHPITSPPPLRRLLSIDFSIACLSSFFLYPVDKVPLVPSLLHAFRLRSSRVLTIISLPANSSGFLHSAIIRSSTARKQGRLFWAS